MVFLQVYDKGNRCIIDKIQYHRLGTSNLFERFMVIRWKIHLEVTSTHLKRELNSKTQWISQCFPIIWPGCKKYLRKAFFQLLKPKIHRQLEVSSVKFVSHSLLHVVLSMSSQLKLDFASFNLKLDGCVKRDFDFSHKAFYKYSELIFKNRLLLKSAIRRKSI